MKKNKRNKSTKKTTKALALPKNYIETQKFKSWCQHFFDRKNPETYGNATKSALRVYNTEKYHSASQIGHENLRKLDNLRLSIADQEGFGFAEMMRIGLAKMMKGEFGDWDKMMVRLGYFEPEPSGMNAVQNNFNFNFSTMAEAIAASRAERGLKL